MFCGNPLRTIVFFLTDYDYEKPTIVALWSDRSRIAGNRCAAVQTLKVRAKIFFLFSLFNGYYCGRGQFAQIFKTKAVKFNAQDALIIF